MANSQRANKSQATPKAPNANACLRACLGKPIDKSYPKQKLGIWRRRYGQPLRFKCGVLPSRELLVSLGSACSLGCSECQVHVESATGSCSPNKEDLNMQNLWAFTIGINNLTWQRGRFALTATYSMTEMLVLPLLPMPTFFRASCQPHEQPSLGFLTQGICTNTSRPQTDRLGHDCQRRRTRDRWPGRGKGGGPAWRLPVLWWMRGWFPSYLRTVWGARVRRMIHAAPVFRGLTSDINSKQVRKVEGAARVNGSTTPRHVD